MSARPAAAESDHVAAFRQRVTLAIMGLVCAICWIAWISAIATAQAWIVIPSSGYTLAPWAPVVATGAGAVVVSLLFELFRRGRAWAPHVASLVLVVTVIPALRDDAFAVALPQSVWLPTLVAFAITSVRWSLLVSALSGVSVAVFHDVGPALRTGSPLVFAGVILSLLVAARLMQDRLLAAMGEQREQVRRLALYDELTGVPNRRLLADRLVEEIKHASRSRRTLAVLFIDLDRFKEVNDTLGHDMGDAVLVEAVQRIRGCIRASDTLARFGGDEFTVLLGDVGDRAAVDRITQKMLARLSEAFALGDEVVYLSGSVGIALYPDDGTSPDDLLKHADQAMFMAKDAGRNQSSYFTRTLQVAAEQRLRVAHDLRSALKEGQLEVYYQPIVELSTGEVHKAEALLRWKHPTKGFISPAVFVPVAESSGLIHEIGDWVFERATEQVKHWRDKHSRRFQISVNRSPAQFRVEGSDRVFWPEHLEKHGLPGDAIVLEITEGLLLDETKGVLQHLEALRSAGIAVSLDDFGTGYSALSYLHKYPIDFLKIDQSFVRLLGPDSKNLSLCKAIIVMAHELGMKVVAEGVETEAQRDLLMMAGCDYAQGYLFAKPLPPAQLEALLDAGTLPNSRRRMVDA